MRARLAPVVMSIDKVDPEGFQTLHAFVSGLVGGERGAYLGIIEWNRREKNARAVEVEVPPINPKLSEAEAHRPAHIERFARGIEERDFQVVDVGWRVNVPELVRHPLFGKSDVSFFDVRSLKCAARQFLDPPALLHDARVKNVLLRVSETLSRNVERDFLPAHECVRLHIRDPGAFWRTDKINVTTQSAPRHRTFYLSRRRAVCVGE